MKPRARVNIMFTDGDLKTRCSDKIIFTDRYIRLRPSSGPTDPPPQKKSNKGDPYSLTFVHF